MKNVVKKLAFVITLLVTFGVQAQDRKERIKNATPQERVAMKTDKMSEKLGLDEAQKKKVKEIFEAEQKEVTAEREAMKAKREAMRAEREKAVAEMKIARDQKHEALKAKLKKVLTEEQLKKWEALQKENVEKFKNHKRKVKR